ncbi:hypothetical protein QJS10_CPA07g00912 [Acorus calamus]|uniref:Zinc protease PQQL-like n=1 Tax=Acorus calamus TaxID=4465 RepID=A0AAV9EH98_ACOCL|nr:hypothetical protein QJS10_CPA07g00912 [Acorus calamus]
MDLLPSSAETPLIARKQGFRSLKLVKVSMDEALPEEPVGVHYGVLDNGLSYYVRSNPKPRMRAALALAVRVGSVLEEEEERGVAHIVEHLAFSATKKYTNHDIVKFLESIGAEFGACQNAMTSSDETIYELLVPVDKPDLLSQAISVLAEFSSEVRVSADDLEKERGAVLEEYRWGRNASGRMQDAHWALMFKDSKYAVRLPIGLEKVIRTVTHDTVKQFYRKWYHLHNMAVIAVGILLIHSCKIPVGEMKIVKDYRDSLVEAMFHCALNQRFFKISRRQDPPYFSCSAGADALVRPVKAYIMTSSCREKGTIEALDSMLMEVARVRLHGFSEREISTVRALMMSDIESAYLERDQMQSTSLRDEYLQHFLHKEPVVGIDYEAQLQKTILPYISAPEVSKFAANFRTSCSCVIKIVEPHACASIEDLRATVLKINSLEEQRSIPPWDEDHVPEEIVITKPNPGNTIESPYLVAIHADLGSMVFCGNSVRVLFSGFAYGGLSELSESEYISCSLGSTIAGEIGVFGYKPSVLMDMLAGKRAEVGTKVGSYMRTFSGDCSPSDLETALQLVYQLFTTDVIPGEQEVKIVMQMAEEAILAQERDPYTAFANRPIWIDDLRKVDPFKACQYFNNCFKDPSTFSIVIVGNIHQEVALPLILQYLGGIPKPSGPILHFNRDDLRGLPFTFPATIIREVVRSPMVEAQCSVQLAFPVELKNNSMMEEIHYVGFLSKLLETKIMQTLRFKHGQIYSVGVSVFLGGNKPSRTEDVRGDAQDEGRIKVRDSLTPLTVQLALQRILPFPCRKQYTVVILMPYLSRLKLLKSFFKLRSNGFSLDAKIMVGAAGALVLAWSLWRYSRTNSRS